MLCFLRLLYPCWAAPEKLSEKLRYHLEKKGFLWHSSIDEFLYFRIITINTRFLWNNRPARFRFSWTVPKLRKTCYRRNQRVGYDHSVTEMSDVRNLPMGWSKIIWHIPCSTVVHPEILPMLKKKFMVFRLFAAKNGLQHSSGQVASSSSSCSELFLQIPVQKFRGYSLLAAWQH